MKQTGKIVVNATTRKHRRTTRIQKQIKANLLLTVYLYILFAMDRKYILTFNTRILKKTIDSYQQSFDISDSMLFLSLDYSLNLIITLAKK